MARKKSIMRSQVVPLLFEECRIIKKRYEYEVPHIKFIRSFHPVVKHTVDDLPLSNLEICITYPGLAADLCISDGCSNSNRNNLKNYIL